MLGKDFPQIALILQGQISVSAQIICEIKGLISKNACTLKQHNCLTVGRLAVFSLITVFMVYQNSNLHTWLV
jgi:hypothetical protein